MTMSPERCGVPRKIRTPVVRKLKIHAFGGREGALLVSCARFGWRGEEPLTRVRALLLRSRLGGADDRGCEDYGLVWKHSPLHARCPSHRSYGVISG